MSDEDTVDGFASAIAESTDIEGAFLLGYALVAEWMTPDGKRWLSSTSGTGSDEGIPPWQTRGYLNEALNHWDYETEEEEE